MKTLIASSRFRYGTRHLEAGDIFTARPRDALILTTLKKAMEPDSRASEGLPRKPLEAPPAAVVEKAKNPSAPEPSDERPALREQYFTLVGKRPYNGWDADELKRRISEAQA